MTDNDWEIFVYFDRATGSTLFYSHDVPKEQLHKKGQHAYFEPAPKNWVFV